jgi:ketosteroid isomerase-like protein
MKKIFSIRNSGISLAFISIFLFSMSGCKTERKPQETAVSTNDVIAAAKEVDSLFLVAYNNADVDALMSLHWNSPDLLIYPPGAPEIKGYNAVKESYIKDFAENKGAKLEYTSVYNVPYADVVAGRGTYTWSKIEADSSVTVLQGRYTDLKAYKDGKMVILLDHSSFLDPPPAPDTTSVN